MATRLSPTDNRIRGYIYDDLDLRFVRGLVKEKTGWDRKAMADAERWYRNFLWLSYRQRRSRQPIGIERRADEFWHAHILDTEDYAETCRRILGRRGFLHHKPASTAAKAANARVLKASEAAYRKEFPNEFAKMLQIGPFEIPCFWSLIFR